MRSANCATLIRSKLCLYRNQFASEWFLSRISYGAALLLDKVDVALDDNASH